MPKSARKKDQAKKAAKKLNVALKLMEESVVAQESDFEAYLKQITEKLVAAGLSSDVGTVAYAGRDATGAGKVQVNVPSGGYASTWPEWAYGVAEAALHANKKVWVIYTVTPFGTNLAQVLCLKDPAS